MLWVFVVVLLVFLFWFFLFLFWLCWWCWWRIRIGRRIVKEIVLVDRWIVGNEWWFFFVLLFVIGWFVYCKWEWIGIYEEKFWVYVIFVVILKLLFICWVVSRKWGNGGVICWVFYWGYCGYCNCWWFCIWWKWFLGFLDFFVSWIFLLRMVWLFFFLWIWYGYW